MTTEEMERFIKCAQLGIACGLWHPYEWLVNDNRTLLQSHPYGNFRQEESKLVGSFLAFFHGCKCHPDDEIGELTASGLSDRINKYYHREKEEVKDVE